MKKAYTTLAIFLALFSFTATAQVSSGDEILASANEVVSLTPSAELPLPIEALEEGAGTQEFYREVFANVTEPPVYINSDYPVVAAGMEEIHLDIETTSPQNSLASDNNSDQQTEVEPIKVIESAVCRSIENHRPIESDTHFSSLIRRIWIYSRVKMPADASSKISHVYYRNGKKIQTVQLAVKGPTFRTRSYKSINQLMDGNWKVEIRTENGTLLDTLEFEVYAECP